MIIEVERKSEAFYIVIVILPIALIVLFSFCMFSLSRDALKVPQSTSDCITLLCSYTYMSLIIILTCILG